MVEMEREGEGEEEEEKEGATTTKKNRWGMTIPLLHRGRTRREKRVREASQEWME